MVGLAVPVTMATASPANALTIDGCVNANATLLFLPLGSASVCL